MFIKRCLMGLFAGSALCASLVLAAPPQENNNAAVAAGDCVPVNQYRPPRLDPSQSRPKIRICKPSNSCLTRETQRDAMSIANLALAGMRKQILTDPQTTQREELAKLKEVEKLVREEIAKKPAC